MVVLLPAPLGPRKPKNRPRGTSNEMPSTATLFRNVLVRLRTTIAGPGGVLTGDKYPESDGRSIPVAEERYSCPPGCVQPGKPSKKVRPVNPSSRMPISEE